MPSLLFKTTECRVGVVGLYSAGKTVLLTSLINHLADHDPDRFPFAGGTATVRKFAPLPPDSGWSQFNYAGFRDGLVHSGQWPRKTTDRSMYACGFERTDWRFSDAVLKLYDLPGERLADAAMLSRDFAGWSDHLLARLHSDTPYRTASVEFLDAVGGATATETDILRTYRLALARLILAFKPLISPSTFLLDTAGGLAKPATPEALSEGRVCGLSADSQFAPLPPEVRAANPALAATFAVRYDRYKAEVAVPFLDGLRSCHSLIVLVDVTMLLAGGVGMYDDNRQIVRDLFEVLRPGESAVQSLGRNLSYLLLPRQLRPAWVNRVAFVAPKLDLVHPTDRDRVSHLLKRMVGKLAADRDGLKAGYFNASAAVSTRVMPLTGEERWLVGVPYRGADGARIHRGDERRFAVSAVPEDWPADWPAGKFAFPEVYPTVPPRKDCPPQQINMEKVFDFVVV